MGNLARRIKREQARRAAKVAKVIQRDKNLMATPEERLRNMAKSTGKTPSELVKEVGGSMDVIKCCGQPLSQKTDSNSTRLWVCEHCGEFYGEVAEGDEHG